MPDAENQLACWRIAEVEAADSADDQKYFRIEPVEGCGTKHNEDLVQEINASVEGLRQEKLPRDTQRAARLKRLKAEYLSELRILARDLEASPPRLNGHRLSKRFGKAVSLFEAGRREIALPEAAYLEPPDPPSRLRFRPLDADATPEQQTLLVDIIRTMTVVDIVFDRRIRKPNVIRRLLRRIGVGETTSGDSTLRASEAEKLRSVYLRELKEIADEGLSSVTNTPYAQKRLETFREAFVSREADVVKNHHVRRLGFVCLTGALLIALLAAVYYVLIPSSTPIETNRIVRNFFLLCAGACAGTWLSFSLRRVVLGFNDLATLEDDRLNPISRMIFVVLLTCLLALLLHTKLMSIEIGGIDVWDPNANAENGALLAIALGVLCGIAERTLSGAISKRADVIISGANGSSPKVVTS